MSTFTLIHHTAPHIPFLPENKWRPAVASLQHTIHCKYPAWYDSPLYFSSPLSPSSLLPRYFSQTIEVDLLNRIDFLCHDISVHVPHHVSSAIPHYRLRLAYDSLKKNWGPVCPPPFLPLSLLSLYFIFIFFSILKYILGWILMFGTVHSWVQVHPGPHVAYPTHSSPYYLISIFRPSTSALFYFIWFCKQIVSNCQIHDDETRLYKTFSKMLQSVGLIHPTINVPKHE